MKNENYTFQISAKGVTPRVTHAAADPVIAVMVFSKQTDAEHAFSVLDVI
jgi:hypothetical protein